MKTSPSLNSENGMLTEVITELERLYDLFNHRFFESQLSKPVISAASKGRKNALGWCTSVEVWKGGQETSFYEINICAEYVDRDIFDVCGTLIHEMVHLYNAQNDIQDCSRSGLYHNKRFKAEAERRGLIVEKDDSRGFATTRLSWKAKDYIESLGLKNFELYRDCNRRNAAENGERKKKRKIEMKIYFCPKCNTTFQSVGEVEAVCKPCNFDFTTFEQLIGMA